MKKRPFTIIHKLIAVFFFSFSCFNFVDGQDAIKIDNYNSLTFFQWGNTANAKVSLGNYTTTQLHARFNVKASQADKCAFKAIMFPPISNDSIGSVENCVYKGAQYYGIYQAGLANGKNYFQNSIGINVASPNYALDVNGDIGCHAILNFIGDTPGVTITSSSQLNHPFTFVYNYYSAPPAPPNPYNPLKLYYWGAEIGGRLECDTFLLRRNPGVGKVLVSDASGSGRWTDASAVTSDYWLVAANKGMREPPTNELTSIYLNPEKYESVLIGTETPQDRYKLAVGGRVLCEELKVKLVADWPDYVFEKNHEVPTLIDVEQFIIENKHLPDIPSSQEVKENGIDVGEMNAKLLKKIEELTVYIIAMQKEIDHLKAEFSTH